MRFTTVLFDLDHTLLDSESSERLAFEHTLRSVGVEDPLTHLSTYQEINLALWRSVETGERTPNQVKVERFEQLATKLGFEADPRELGETYVAGLGEFGELYQGAAALLDSIATTSTLGLVTNGIGTVQRRRIDRLGLGHWFKHIAISGELGVAKPDPSIFGFLGINPWTPASTVMIGDSLTSDIAAGANAGITTCWFNPSESSKTGPSTPTVEVRSFEELWSFLADGS